MKILTLLTLILSGCAMSKSEMTWQSLHAIDVAQTLNTAGSSDPCWRESGIPTKYLIGEKPEPEAIIAWGVAYSVLHYYAGRWLDNSDLSDGLKTFIRTIDLSNEALIVSRNHSEGARPWGDNARGCIN